MATSLEIFKKKLKKYLYQEKHMELGNFVTSHGKQEKGNTLKKKKCQGKHCKLNLKSQG